MRVAVRMPALLARVVREALKREADPALATAPPRGVRRAPLMACALRPVTDGPFCALPALLALLATAFPAAAEAPPASPATAGAAEAGPAASMAPVLGVSPGGSSAPSVAYADLLREADRWLLDGDLAPVDLRQRLRPLRPAERLLALAYLRRLGLLDGPALPLGELLAVEAPASAAGAALASTGATGPEVAPAKGHAAPRGAAHDGAANDAPEGDAPLDDTSPNDSPSREPVPLDAPETLAAAQPATDPAPDPAPDPPPDPAPRDPASPTAPSPEPAP